MIFPPVPGLGDGAILIIEAPVATTKKRGDYYNKVQCH